MGTADEFVKPLVGNFTSGRWFAASIVVGFYLGFVDTVIIAAILGAVNFHVPAYVGVPTTMVGYLFTGYILGRLAPSRITWEIPMGILVAVLLFMMGMVGFKGMTFGPMVLNYVIVPAIAWGVCYFGILAARNQLKKR
jgi:hypothetical protein